MDLGLSWYKKRKTALRSDVGVVHNTLFSNPFSMHIRFRMCIEKGLEGEMTSAV